LISKNELDKALKRILKFTTHFNQYLQKKQPWNNKAAANTTMFVAINAVNSIAIMLEPFIPFSCEKIWSQLGMPGSIHSQRWSSASQMKIPPGQILGKIEPLFLKIEQEDVKKQKTELGKIK
jgi:methionyl-tRNA synthetase